MRWMQNSLVLLRSEPIGRLQRAGRGKRDTRLPRSVSRSLCVVRPPPCLAQAAWLRDRNKDGAANLRHCLSHFATDLLLASSRTNGSHVWPTGRDQLAPRARHTRLFSPRDTTSNDPTAERRKLFRQLGERNSARAVPKKVNIQRPVLPRVASAVLLLAWTREGRKGF